MPGGIGECKLRKYQEDEARLKQSCLKAKIIRGHPRPFEVQVLCRSIIIVFCPRISRTLSLCVVRQKCTIPSFAVVHSMRFSLGRTISRNTRHTVLTLSRRTMIMQIRLFHLFCFLP